jgi:hypothetical protein
VPPIETKQVLLLDNTNNRHTLVLQKVVQEMKAFCNDIQSFWLRKMHKPVLAVLAVVTKGKIKLYRGTNMAGSLCAEHNVIGTDLADNPSLK